MKRLVVFALLICFTQNAFAQDWAKVPEEKPASERALRTGDRIPFKELHNVLNYPKKTYKFSDHKPKLTILDFWDMRCSPCIKFWPKALELKKEFGDDLEIILVNPNDNQKDVKAFLEKRKRIDGTDMNLPIVCRDSTIRKNFPLWSFPTYVWIGADGAVGSIGFGKDMTRENIKRWINSGPFKMDQLSDKKYYDVTPWEPIFVNGNGGEKPSDVFLWTSSLTKGQDDVGANPWIFHDSVAGYGISVTNSPIAHLYGSAYNNRLEWSLLDFLPNGRMELIAKDTTKYWGDGSLSGNAFNYQLLCAEPKSREELLRMMRQDLDRYFGFDVKWEKRVKKCAVLSMPDSTLATKRKSYGSEGKFYNGDIIIDSLDVKTLIMAMEVSTDYYRNHRYPIVDETHYKGMILGIREKGSVSDREHFKKVLAMGGVRLTFEMREVDVLVLREPKGK